MSETNSETRRSEMITCVNRAEAMQYHFIQELVQHGRHMFPVQRWPDAVSHLKVLLSCMKNLDRYDPELDIEHNEDWWQVIPYLVVFSQDGKVLSYRRAGEESRLHGNISVGLGGHSCLAFNSEQAFLDTLAIEAERELSEETSGMLSLQDSGLQMELAGLIYDSTSSVSRVHIGLVCQLTATEEIPQKISSDECGILSLVRPYDLLPSDQCEVWTNLALLLISERDRVKMFIEHQVDNMTAARVNANGPYMVPQRDIAFITAELLGQIVVTSNSDTWPQLAKLLYGEDRLEAARFGVENVVNVFGRALRLGTEEPSLTFGQALDRVGFFSQSHEARGLFCAQLGLLMLAELWTAVRQYSQSGDGPITQFEMVSEAAGQLITEALGGGFKLDSAVKSLCDKANRLHVSKAELLQMVDASFPT